MNSETQTYEAQILQQLIKNAERIAVMHKEVSDVKAEVSDIKQEVSNIKQEISNIKQDVSGIKTEMSVVKMELSEVKSKADRAEWWLKLIAGAIVLSFFKDQLISFF